MYKLIIVDDDIFMLENFVSGFDWNEMGFEVVASFTSSADCLEYLSNNSVDAILTDICMPNVSGLELAEICSTEYPDLGIIIISAYDNFEYARTAIKYNVIDYVLKPIDDDSFTESLNRLKNFLNKINNSDFGIDNDANSRIKEICKYVNDHYSENLTSNDIASHVMLNPNYLSSFFKKHTGKTLSLYIRKVRLEKACYFLKHTDMKITAIAEEINYKTTTHFYKHFFEEYQMTPASYRQQFKSTDKG